VDATDGIRSKAFNSPRANVAGDARDCEVDLVVMLGVIVGNLGSR
jgi:hypothetical protein